MSYWDGHDPGLAILPAVQVPNLTVILGAFAPGDLPGGTLTLGVYQVVSGGPADDEPRLVSAEFAQPGSAGIALVADMDHPLLPPLDALGKQLGRLPPAMAGQGTALVHQRMAARVEGPCIPAIITVSHCMPGTNTGRPPGGL